MFTERRINTRQLQREKLPWPEGKPFKILSLDGGGICGIYGATILSYIEEELTDSKPIGQYFDMVAGTSTGGIMALGVAAEIEARKICGLYEVEGKHIFESAWYWFGPVKLFLQTIRNLYAEAPLEKELKKQFGELLLGDAKTRVMIPAFLIPDSEVAVFKTDHHPDYKKDWQTPMWKVARATSAAPTYFPGLHCGDKKFLDGGIWANNPTMLAVVEALSSYDIVPEQIHVLSIGAGNKPFNISAYKANGGFWNWKEVIKASMFLSTDNATAQASLLLGPQNLLRLEPSGEGLGIELDDWKTAMSILVPMAKAHCMEGLSDIRKFFEQAASPRGKFYSA